MAFAVCVGLTPLACPCQLAGGIELDTTIITGHPWGGGAHPLFPLNAAAAFAILPQ